MITKRYPNRKVYPEMHLKHDEFAYFGLGGHVRMVKVKDWSIWVCDEDAGWPYMKRVR